MLNKISESESESVMLSKSDSDGFASKPKNYLLGKDRNI